VYGKSPRRYLELNIRAKRIFRRVLDMLKNSNIIKTSRR